MSEVQAGNVNQHSFATPQKIARGKRQTSGEFFEKLSPKTTKCARPQNADERKGSVSGTYSNPRNCRTFLTEGL